AGKLIISIDEVLLDLKEDSECIKNLSTSKYSKAEAKGKDKVEVEFYDEFILCSNNEEYFMKIDANEIRYWVCR
ncbi:MAG: primase-helicase family protein, partial [Flavobacterium sp.]